MLGNKKPTESKELAICNAIEAVQKIKSFSNDIIKKTYALNPQQPLFYYKLNNELSKGIYYSNGESKNELQKRLLVGSDFFLEGEIGYTLDSVQIRHPNANIQFTQYINSEGGQPDRGPNRLRIENIVIEALKTLGYIQFGNDKKPKSKEIFRFPCKKHQVIREKIEQSIKPYIANNIWA